MGKELTEIERLDLAARAKVSEAHFSAIRVVTVPMTLFIAYLAFVTQGPRYETMAVRAFAVFALLTTIALWVRWRYAGYLEAMLFVLAGVSAFWFDYQSADWIFRLIYCLCLVAAAIDPWRKATIYATSRSPGWEKERSQVRQWLKKLHHPGSAGEVIEFQGGSFWTGYFTYRLLDLGGQWALVKFKRGTSKLADYRVRDRSALSVTPLPGGRLHLEMDNRALGDAELREGLARLIPRTNPPAGPLPQ